MRKEHFLITVPFGASKADVERIAGEVMDRLGYAGHYSNVFADASIWKTVGCSMDVEAAVPDKVRLKTTSDGYVTMDFDWEEGGTPTDENRII